MWNHGLSRQRRPHRGPAVISWSSLLNVYAKAPLTPHTTSSNPTLGANNLASHLTEQCHIARPELLQRSAPVTPKNVSIPALSRTSSFHSRSILISVVWTSPSSRLSKILFLSATPFPSCIYKLSLSVDSLFMCLVSRHLNILSAVSLSLLWWDRTSSPFSPQWRAMSLLLPAVCWEPLWQRWSIYS